MNNLIKKWWFWVVFVFILITIVGIFIEVSLEQPKTQSVVERQIQQPSSAKRVYYYNFIGTALTNVAGRTLEVAAATETNTREECLSVGNNKVERLKSDFENTEWKILVNECDGSKDTNELVSPSFQNKPLDTAYVSFTDLNGYRTRITFPSSDNDVAVFMSELYLKQLEEAGTKDAKVIYPSK